MSELNHADNRSNSLVIVAIPSDEDPSREFSSEKVPHLTLLYLGEIVEGMDVDSITSFVRRKSSSLEPFTLNVKKRGVLGDADADVVFFADDNATKKTRDFRALLLSSEPILAAYKNQEQHTNWHPHVTLGYPEKPAKSQETLDQVTFDKIAVWNTDFDGPTFELKKGSPMAHVDAVLETAGVLTTDTLVYDDEKTKPLFHALGFNLKSRLNYVDAILSADGYLAHYGIPGMRWGRRRTANELDSAAAATEKAKDLGASDDAIVRAQTEGKLRAGGVGALSNQEIQTLITRVNLEKQYAQAFPPPTPERSKKAKIKDWATDLLINEGQKQVKETLNLVTTKKRNDYLRSRDLMEIKDKKKGSESVESGKKDKDTSKKDRDSILDPNQPAPKKSKKEKKRTADPFSPDRMPAGSKSVQRYSFGYDAQPGFTPKRETEDLVYKVTTL